MTADVIVIGSGIAGAALTYALARRGVRVLLLEKGTVASGASSGTMGMALWIGLHKETDLKQAKEGLRRLESLEIELDTRFDYRLLPSLVLAPDEAMLAKLRQQAQVLTQAGFSVELVDTSRIGTFEPALRAGSFTGALFARQGHLDATALTKGYVRAAQRLGAQIHEQTTVDHFTVENHRINRVHAGQESWPAGNVVLAAGAWTRKLGVRLKLELPIYTLHGEAVASSPLPPTLRTMLMVANTGGHSTLERRVAATLGTAGRWETWADESEAQDISMVQTVDGRVLLGQISRAIPRTAVPGRPQAAERIWQAAVALVPQLDNGSIQRTWIAPVPFTPNQQPLLGQVPGWSNLHLCAGFKSALITAPLVCDSLAGQIVGGREQSTQPDQVREPGGVAK